MNDVKLPDRLTIGVLSRLTDCGVETIRYYERIGLLAPPPRSDGGHRLYAAAQVRRLRFIRHARELDLGLDQIRKLLELVDGNHYTCGQVLALAVEHRRVVRRKIDELARLEQALGEVIARCEDVSASGCPIVDVLFGE